MSADEHAQPRTRRGERLSGLGAEESAENLRERVYGTVSVLAALAALLRADAHGGAAGTIATLVVTVGSLFAASLFADVTAHLAAHQARPDRREVGLLLASRSQILASAVLPVVLVAAAGWGWWDLSTALGWAVGTQVLTLGVVGGLAVRGTELPIVGKALLVAAEIGLGLAVVAVKLLVH